MKSQVHKETKKRVIIFSMIYFNKEIEEVTKTFSWDKEYCRERFCEFCLIQYNFQLQKDTKIFFQRIILMHEIACSNC